MPANEALPRLPDPVAQACDDRIAIAFAPAPTRDAWRVVFILSLISFVIIGGTLTSLGVYLPVLQRDLGWTETQMGGLPVALLFGMSIGNLLVGRLMPRLGIRAMLASGIVATAAGWAAAGRAEGLPQFMAAMALAGAGAGLATIVPGVAVITHRFDARRGLAIGVFIGACALAGSIAPSLSGFLIAGLGWRAALLTMGAATAIICLPLASLSGSADAPKSPPDGAGAVSAEMAAGPTARQVAARPAFWLLVAALTVSQLCMNAILFSVVAMLLRSGLAQESAIAIYSAANLMALPGLFGGGALADRYGPGLVLPCAMLMQALGTLCLLGVGAAGLAESGAAIAGFILLWGLAGGLPSQIGPMLLAELTGTRAFTTMVGVVFTVSGLVGTLAPLMTGALYEMSGGYALPVATCGLLTTVAALMPLWAKRPG